MKKILFFIIAITLIYFIISLRKDQFFNNNITTKTLSVFKLNLSNDINRQVFSNNILKILNIFLNIKNHHLSLKKIESPDFKNNLYNTYNYFIDDLSNNHNLDSEYPIPTDITFHVSEDRVFNKKKTNRIKKFVNNDVNIFFHLLKTNPHNNKNKEILAHLLNRMLPQNIDTDINFILVDYVKPEKNTETNIVELKFNNKLFLIIGMTNTFKYIPYNTPRNIIVNKIKSCFPGYYDEETSTRNVIGSCKNLSNKPSGKYQSCLDKQKQHELETQSNKYKLSCDKFKIFNKITRIIHDYNNNSINTTTSSTYNKCPEALPSRIREMCEESKKYQNLEYNNINITEQSQLITSILDDENLDLEGGLKSRLQSEIENENKPNSYSDNRIEHQSIINKYKHNLGLTTSSLEIPNNNLNYLDTFYNSYL